MSDERQRPIPSGIPTTLHGWRKHAFHLSVKLSKSESQNQTLQEAARNAHGILQTNLGDVDPHVRAACDLLWNALSPTQETD